MAEGESIEGVVPEVANGTEHRLIFLDIGKGKLEAVGDSQVCLDIVF